MSKPIQELLFTILPVILLFSGGVLAVYRAASSSFKSITLHFAAGVVFSVVAVELLPDMVRLHAPLTIIIGFTMGIVFMLGVKQVTGNLEKKAVGSGKSSGLPWPALSAVGIDLLIDGILLGIGFAAGEKEGLLLAIALSLECFSLGIAIVTTIDQVAEKKRSIFVVLAVMGSIFVAGAAAGLLLLHNAGDQLMELILSFGAAALLYLVTEELLVEAHEEKDSPYYTATFFAGFLIFLILGIIL
ncbi:transporter [Mucilaginibacter sp. PAMB04274]|uniref:ZIP family metal transporter n=1 Tax=Mucilaginibacter sp. PAMB04274 TaxID=3138568 RepID=UPI0031F64165